MRVLVILTELNRYGGTLRFLERLLEIHARRGIETALLAPSGETPDALAALVERHGLEFLRAPGRSSSETAPLLTPYFDLLFCRDAVRSCRPDLLVVSSADPGRMSVALFLSCPALYVLHSVPESRFRLLPRLYLRLGSSLRNQVVTVSDAAALGISQSMGIPLGRISVLRNGCTLPAVVPAPATSAVILTAGHVVDYKNPWLWLEVARKVLERYPEATFIWLGDGPLLDPLRLKVIELALQDRILLPGYVEEPSSWFARARVYFQPSLRESQGIAVLEAMAHGVPCVVADSGGLPESVLDRRSGFVCRADDVSGFSAGLFKLLEDGALRERLGGAGRLLVQEKFSPSRQEQKLLALYDNLVRKAEKR